jgi:KipI family sensor histidine kinase inhibitor
MRLLPCGDSGLLVELADLEDVLALYAELVEDVPEGVVDLVPAARTLMLRLDPARTDPDRVARAVREVEPQPGHRPDAGRLDVPVIYDGEDLAEVGRLTGLGERGVVEAHTAQEWTVAFCGFAPGFGYLVGTDDRLTVPRRDVPRTRVPARAVALAGEFSGVYPRESPGGWQLIGHTTLQPWDLDRDPPALLVPGVRVRFVEA